VDHKRIGEGDTGPNTGGMGTISPAPQMTPSLEAEIMQRIIRPTLEVLKKRGIAFRGFLFAGLMLTKDGPKLLEYNVRLGDPETQALLPRITSDLAALMYAAASGNLSGMHVEASDDYSVCIVMAAQGYPGTYARGTLIKGVEEATKRYVSVIHAGTKKKDGLLYADGGRVLGLNATAATLNEALQKAYEGVVCIDWAEGYYRRDIGHRFVGK
jgi:phosphoribosylamine--glycine ligase